MKLITKMKKYSQTQYRVHGAKMKNKLQQPPLHFQKNEPVICEWIKNNQLAKNTGCMYGENLNRSGAPYIHHWTKELRHICAVYKWQPPYRGAWQIYARACRAGSPTGEMEKKKKMKKGNLYAVQSCRNKIHNQNMSTNNECVRISESNCRCVECHLRRSPRNPISRRSCTCALV